MSDTAAILRYEANKKSTGAAYLLFFLLGGLGAHRFYLGKLGTGLLVLVLTFLSLAGLPPAMIILAIILIFDLFMIPSMTRAWNSRLAEEVLDVADEPRANDAKDGITEGLNAARSRSKPAIIAILIVVTLAMLAALAAALLH